MPETGESSSEPLRGRVAVVTGAAQGLGLGIVEEMARQGADVVLADLQLQKAQVEAGKLANRGLLAHGAQLDVTDSAAVNSLMDGIWGERGRLDILVNSAGIGQDIRHTTELSDEEWDRVLRVNLTGTFYTCRAAGRIMERQESGAIVNLASINAHSPAALVASYNVSKAAVISLTQTMAVELAPYGVRVNAISPGPVYTDFNRRVMAQRSASLGIQEDEMIERVRKAVPLGRWGQPEDIAQMVAFLCSDRASWITGQAIQVTGGLAGVSAAPPRREVS